MQGAACLSTWLLPISLLLILSNSLVRSDPASLYKQQVVIVLDDDPTIQKAGQLLYQKYDTGSHVLKWNETEQMLEQVEWNAEADEYEASQNLNQPLPIGPQKTFSWSDTFVQVLGYGDVDEEQPTVISGFSAEDLALMIIEELSHGDVGCINIIGYTTRGPPTSESPTYLNQFMTELQQLQQFNTTARLTSVIVMVDHSGRELTGELLLGVNQTDIEWRHTSPPDVWIGYFTGANYQIERTSILDRNPMMNSPSFGILPVGTEVHVTDYRPSDRTTYKVTDNSAFGWVDEIAQKTYWDTPRSRATPYARQVQFLSGSREVHEVSVLEIESVFDLLKEQRHYGDEGPADDVTYIFYRFGDWVLSMNEVNFYVNVDGIIVDPADPGDKTAKVENILSQWHAIPDTYPSMQLNTSSNFFDEITLWINGNHDDIGLELENAYDAQCGVAMFLSESIRSFHVHITNMMSLDLAQRGYLSKEYFFSSHPMARRGTWQIRESETGKKKTGLDPLQDHLAISGSLPDQELQSIFDDIVLRVSRISKSWLSHIDDVMLMGSRDPPPATRAQEAYTGKSHQAGLLSSIEDIGSTAPWSHEYLRVFELNESAIRLLSSNVSEAEMGAIGTQVQDFSHIDYASLPLQASIALVGDHAYVSDLISRELYQKEQQTGKKYEVVPDSVEVEEQGDIVKFFVRELGNVSSELELIKTVFDQSKLQSKALLEKLLSLSNKTKPIVAWLKKGEAINNAVIGMVSSINELEDGHILKGTYDLAKNAYKFGDVTGINKAAGKYLGKALKKLADKAGESVVTSVAKKAEGKVLSVVGEVKELKAKFAPIIGTLFDIYNIYEDFNRHSTIGYIDGAFDIATTVLSLLGPEAEPFAAALSIIKMGVDYFYNDISKELHALPPDASVGQVVVAVLKGIAEGIVDIIKDIWHNLNIFGLIGDAHKLDRQFHKDQEFLKGMSDYRNYFDVVKVNGSNASEINFAGGADSWNGGDITFHLGENGHSTLSLETVDSDGHPRQESHDILTSGVEDIVLGIGESHAISFKQVKIKFLWLIPVDSKRVISGIDGEKQTLHGTYYGNSHNNKFIAVQELPPQSESTLGYNLHDYHYTLYGGGGNDSFYLGPQPTYVEGNEGSDAYFINSTATITEINSHSGDGQDDTMIINLDFDQLTAQREGLNLTITSSDTHRIVIRNWFHDVTHQRMVFKTGDGVLFKVSATITQAVQLLAYAISGSAATQSQVYDARLPVYSEVFAIAGSEYDDVLFGNDLDNQLNGAGGLDTLTGGEGQDTYTVDLDKGVDTINNFAVNGEVDTLVIGTHLDQLIFSSREESNDLFITRSESGGTIEPSSTGAVVKNWFLNETYQHMIVVTNDKAVVKVSATKNSSVSYQPFIINMTHDEEQALERGDSYARRLDLNSDPVYSEVTTVLGTSHNDTIIGNGKDNYITGAQGFDYIEGKEGADTYVVKKGDGSKVIVNCAKDKEIDTLLFDARFDDIHLSNSSSGDLVLSSSPDNGIEVTFRKWFQNTTECQHLLVRSVDGVTFELPSAREFLTKTAKSVDNSNFTTDVQLILTGKWKHVERVIGSQGNDQILGNSLDNYIDPGVGNCYLQGGNGSDMYIIRSTYGEENIINNYAEDDQADTILFLVPFLSIEVEVVGVDIRLSSLSADGLVQIRIMDYNFELLEHARHLMVTTSDGISFVLPVANSSNTGSYKLIPVSINMAHATTGQHLQLTAYPSFSEVRTVYGSSKYQNRIIGNGQNNTLVGGSKPDFLQGLDGDDTLKGGDGNDVIEGGPGSDILVGGDGNDSLDGGEDNDIISPGLGANTVNGGTGTDTVIYSGDVSIEEGVLLDLSLGTCVHDGNAQDTLSGIENAYGTDYDDTLVGDDLDNVLVGKGGNDTLSPGSGYDILNGGNGSDIYDLTGANGTVTIENQATDQASDLVIMSYTNLSSLWYEVAGDDVVIRVINSQYPVFYDGSKPAVVFRSFMVAPEYQHASIETADGNVVDLKAFIDTKPESTPGSPPVPLSLYVTLAVLLTGLCVLVSCVFLVVYKIRSNRRKKRYIKL